MPNLFETLGSATGIGRPEMQKIWDDVKANNAKLNACAKHRFDGGKYKFGDKPVCLECGGKIDGVAVMHYIRGFTAAGGDPNEIWPEWR